MFKQASEIPFPANEKRSIWRFIDFEEFVDFLDSSSLYFSRLDLLDDNIERSATDIDYVKSRVADELFRVASESKAPVSKGSRLEKWWATKAREGEQENLIQMVKNIQPGETVWANCWHAHEGESLVLWKTYAYHQKNIAISSSIEALRDCISSESDPAVSIGAVSYTEETGGGISKNPVKAAFTKHRGLQSEQEIRAIVSGMSPQLANAGPGLKVAIDKQALVHTIHISPRADDRFCDLVQRVAQTYGLNKPCNRSEYASAR
jgi:hypothetical protein